MGSKKNAWQVLENKVTTELGSKYGEAQRNKRITRRRGKGQNYKVTTKNKNQSEQPEIVKTTVNHCSKGR